ncbi:AMP-binding protein [Streptomyces rectiviolaceus]|uniref:AMP-binding protein n=1 Tax=Streptomyces rectiviolaceus TaxID=332591 RepID=UPI0036445031
MNDRTLYDWFASSVDRYPEEPALEVKGQTLTYRQLDERSCAVAAALVEAHGKPPPGSPCWPRAASPPSRAISPRSASAPR